MSLELCILASGSGGNCSVLRCPAGAMLIDAGIGPRTTAKRLAGTGVRVEDVRAICLTHLDGDHFARTWLATLVKHQIQVFCHRGCFPAVRRLVSGLDGFQRFCSLVHCFDDQSFEPLPGLNILPIPLAHDDAGSHGFLIEGFGRRFGYATDLGHVPEALLDRFCDLDLLAIESNYDTRMQLESDRPWFLKQRIMGGAGHLSNDQALTAVRRILDRCEQEGREPPGHIALLHRSRQCNCPDLLRRLFGQDPRIAPRLTIAEQFQRTEWLRPRTLAPHPGEQLVLAWG